MAAKGSPAGRGCFAFIQLWTQRLPMARWNQSHVLSIKLASRSFAGQQSSADLLLRLLIPRNEIRHSCPSGLGNFTIDCFFARWRTVSRLDLDISALPKVFVFIARP